MKRLLLTSVTILFACNVSFAKVYRTTCDVGNQTKEVTYTTSDQIDGMDTLTVMEESGPKVYQRPVTKRRATTDEMRPYIAIGAGVLFGIAAMTLSIRSLVQFVPEIGGIFGTRVGASSAIGVGAAAGANWAYDYNIRTVVCGPIFQGRNTLKANDFKEIAPQ